MHRLRRYSFLIVIASVGLFGMTYPAFAAPFCVEITGMTPQCVYFDPAECRERAHQLNALCTVNPDELKIVPGSGRYCVVNASHSTLCMYTDMQSCNAVAIKERDAVCVDGGPTETQADPFRTEPDRRY